MGNPVMKSFFVLMLFCASAVAQVVTNPGANRLDRLRDVTITNATDGQGLSWNASAGRWVNTNAGAGDITGINLTGNILTGGGSSGEITIGLSTNAVVAAVHPPASITNEPGGPLLFTWTPPGQDFTFMWGNLIDSLDDLYLSSTNGVTIADGAIILEDGGSLNFQGPNPGESSFVFWNGANLIYQDEDDNEHVIIHSGNLPDITLSIPAGSFTGPLKTDTVGWDWLQVDTAGSTFMAQGFKTSSATQAAGTASATIMVPPSSTGWTTTGCLRIVLIAESVTTTNCKFDVTVLSHDASMVNRVLLYSSTNNAFASATVPTVFGVNAASFSAAPIPGGFLTIDVRMHTRNNLGAYICVATARFKQ